MINMLSEKIFKFGGRMNMGFIGFNLKKCIKVNVATSLIFIIISLPIYFIVDLMETTKRREFPNGQVCHISPNLLVGVLIVFLLFILILVYLARIPKKINLYKNFWGNFKYYIGVILCNIFLVWYMQKSAIGFETSVAYFFISSATIFISLLDRHILIKEKHKDRASY